MAKEKTRTIEKTSVSYRAPRLLGTGILILLIVVNTALSWIHRNYTEMDQDLKKKIAFFDGLVNRMIRKAEYKLVVSIAS